MTAAQQQQAAKNFAAYWKGKGYEKGESQPFWLSLLRDVYGVEHPEQFILPKRWPRPLRRPRRPPWVQLPPPPRRQKKRLPMPRSLRPRPPKRLPPRRSKRPGRPASARPKAPGPPKTNRANKANKHALRHARRGASFLRRWFLAKTATPLSKLRNYGSTYINYIDMLIISTSITPEVVGNTRVLPEFRSIYTGRKDPEVVL